MLLLCCCDGVVVLLLCRCDVVAMQMQRCCDDVATLPLHCCHAVVGILLSCCCYVVVAITVAITTCLDPPIICIVCVYEQATRKPHVTSTRTNAQPGAQSE
jgi:hypothetical protein